MEEKKCIICGKPLQSTQRKYCSNTCAQKGHYIEIKNNPNTTFHQIIRGYRRKLKLIEMKGGGCEICGYNKNIAALDFHHLDANTKKFNIDGRVLSNKKWEDLLEEAEKCILLCANCHRELHNPELTLDNINTLKTISEFKALNNKELLHYKECPICHSRMLKSDNRTYCCNACKEKARIEQFSKYPTLDQVNECYKKLKSWQKVADYYSVTRRIIQGIRKRKL